MPRARARPVYNQGQVESIVRIAYPHQLINFDDISFTLQTPNTVGSSTLINALTKRQYTKADDSA